MMGTVIERALVSPAGPTRRPALPDPPPGDRHADGPRPLILDSRWHAGARVTRVLRPDGTIFTVTVPSLGVYEHTEHLAPRHPWITDERGAPELSTVGALRLAAAVHP